MRTEEVDGPERLEESMGVAGVDVELSTNRLGCGELPPESVCP